MSHSIALETTDVEMWKHLQSLHIEGVSISRVIRLSEKTKLKLIVAFSSGVAINLFSSALYDALKNFPSHEATIDGKQVTGNQVQIGMLINSQVHIKQSASETDGNAKHNKGSHGCP